MSPALLNELRDRFRVAIAFLPDEDAARSFVQAIEAAPAQWNERDLVVWLVSPLEPRPTRANVHFGRDENEELRFHFGLKAGQSAFILVGKDGGEKLRRAGVPPFAELWALIDSMPMRQREMRERFQAPS